MGGAMDLQGGTRVLSPGNAGIGEGVLPAKITEADLIHITSAEATWYSESYQAMISGERDFWMKSLFPLVGSSRLWTRACLGIAKY
jgi:hypothetical protein